MENEILSAHQKAISPALNKVNFLVTVWSNIYKRAQQLLIVTGITNSFLNLSDILMFKYYDILKTSFLDILAVVAMDVSKFSFVTP